MSYKSENVIIIERLLTKRETEVLQMAADGKTIEGTASILFITGDTVDTHRRNLISKLDAENIAHAAAIGIRKGIIN